MNPPRPPHDNRTLIRCLAAAAAMEYEPSFGASIAIPQKALCLGHMHGAGVHIANMAHDFQALSQQALTVNAKPTQADIENARFYGRMSSGCMLFASALAGMEFTAYTCRNLHVGRKGDVYLPKERDIWTPSGDHLVKSWGAELLEIFQGVSLLPSEIPGNPAVVESGSFAIPPNDSRIVQVDALIQKLSGVVKEASEKPNDSAEFRTAVLAAPAHGFLCLSVALELILNTGLVPANTILVSLGFKNGMIVGKIEGDAIEPPVETLLVTA